MTPLLCAALVLPLAAGAPQLRAAVDSAGGFAVTFDGSPWLQGGEVRIGNLSSHAGLKLLSRTHDAGRDALGGYTSETMVWGSLGDMRPLMHASIRSYDEDPSFLVFEQFFPQDLHVDAAPWGTKMAAPVTLFPSFKSDSPAGDLDSFAYHGVFPSMRHCKLSSFAASHQGGLPLVIYNATGPRPATVFSPLTKGTVPFIPAGWKQMFLLSAAFGVLDGMSAWGDRMLEFTGKKRADMYRDDVVGSIGFWTDNGGYYHYDTGSNETYEEVLPKVKAYHDSLGIPFKHWQFDSWFYPKDGKVDPGGGGGAVVNWTALPAVFPHSMAYIQSKLGVPMVMHNRQWSPTSDYVKHEPFKWYASERAAIPEDPEAFFRWFFTQQEGWGLAMYEQDWMCTEYDNAEALQTNISMGDLWLHGMAIGAESSGRTVQYCMPYPYDVLSAAAYPAVTNARATDDYIGRDKQWAIGATSMFYWAIGILPFKDGFYSSNLPQVGGQVVGPETAPNRAALMAVLSGAMVGPMDGIYLLNATRVMSSCRADGKVLKPDRPVMPLESCFDAGVDPAGCHNYFTYSDVPGLGRAFYIFMNQPGQLHLKNLTPVAGDYLVYDWYSGLLTWLDAATPESAFSVQAGYEGHSYALLTPAIHGTGWVLVGERAKLVPTSSIRFRVLDARAATLSVDVYGVAGEVVDVCAAERHSGLMCKEVRFQQSGWLAVTFAAQDSNGLVTYV
ncbi:unnamed protein product [Symbiodinium pilosum]|uniref:Glycoside hydrolase family 31 N-terminal domain-containing protein n=1 Tax=Symbiodinium pilosum TaxID=2952 RepID=A0A812N686_SYMPI|nr:unnamed protein product [Symbiodinium pilosum]